MPVSGERSRRFAAGEGAYPTHQYATSQPAIRGSPGKMPTPKVARSALADFGTKCEALALLIELEPWSVTWCLCDTMLHYPKIPGSKDAPDGRCVAFEKLDGTNLHWCWDRDCGWHA